MANEERPKTLAEAEAPAPLVDRKEVSDWSFYRAIIAEFMATLLFLYISLTTLVGTIRVGAGSVGLIETAWAFGGMIFILVYCIAGISGGHINPAVTFGLFVAKKVTITRALAYIVAQCLGAMCGAAIARGVQGSEEFHTYGQGAVNGVKPGHSIGQALAAELMGTFVLLYTVLSATDPTRMARDSHVPVSCFIWPCILISYSCTTYLIYHRDDVTKSSLKYRKLYYCHSEHHNCLLESFAGTHSFKFLT